MNPYYNTNPYHEQETDVLEEILTADINELVVYNDDVNTFEHVIETLIKICGHTAEQAEQCTLLIHYKGKCSVKNGTFESLKPLRQGICDKGISAEIH
ncbi:MAG TPA: ATP-dependent Clp protease adaptor ClpS [Cytophagaceae bacterium]|jgi:ATP-dependent Clp protease adaptor protein ClpS